MLSHTEHREETKAIANMTNSGDVKMRKETTHHTNRKKSHLSTHFPTLNTLLEASAGRGTADETGTATEASATAAADLSRYSHGRSVQGV